MSKNIFDLSKEQIADLVIALEDYRDDFRTKEKDAALGFGLDAEYWASRAKEIEVLIGTVTAHFPGHGHRKPF